MTAIDLMDFTSVSDYAPDSGRTSYCIDTHLKIHPKLLEHLKLRENSYIFKGDTRFKDIIDPEGLLENFVRRLGSDLMKTPGISHFKEPEKIKLDRLRIVMAGYVKGLYLILQGSLVNSPCFIQALGEGASVILGTRVISTLPYSFLKLGKSVTPGEIHNAQVRLKTYLTGRREHRLYRFAVSCKEKTLKGLGKNFRQRIETELLSRRSDMSMAYALDSEETIEDIAATFFEAPIQFSDEGITRADIIEQMVKNKNTVFAGRKLRV